MVTSIRHGRAAPVPTESPHTASLVSDVGVLVTSYSCTSLTLKKLGSLTQFSIYLATQAQRPALKTKSSDMPKNKLKPKARASSLKREVRAQMTIHKDGTASFHVRGYDFRFADMPIAVNGYLFAPVRPNEKGEP